MCIADSVMSWTSLLVVMRCTCTCRSVLPSPLSTPPMQVLDFGWPDHLAPSLERLSSVCRSMKSWLDTDPQHVVVVHCKGGKGRTGCVIAAFMNYSEICQRYIHTCMMIMYMCVIYMFCDASFGVWWWRWDSFLSFLITLSGWYATCMYNNSVLMYNTLYMLHVHVLVYCVHEHVL